MCQLASDAVQLTNTTAALHLERAEKPNAVRLHLLGNCEDLTDHFHMAAALPATDLYQGIFGHRFPGIATSMVSCWFLIRSAHLTSQNALLTCANRFA